MKRGKKIEKCFPSLAYTLLVFVVLTFFTFLKLYMALYVFQPHVCFLDRTVFEVVKRKDCVWCFYFQLCLNLKTSARANRRTNAHEKTKKDFKVEMHNIFFSFVRFMTFITTATKLNLLVGACTEVTGFQETLRAAKRRTEVVKLTPELERNFIIKQLFTLYRKTKAI